MLRHWHIAKIMQPPQMVNINCTVLNIVVQDGMTRSPYYKHCIRTRHSDIHDRRNDSDHKYNRHSLTPFSFSSTTWSERTKQLPWYMPSDLLFRWLSLVIFMSQVNTTNNTRRLTDPPDNTVMRQVLNLFLNIVCIGPTTLNLVIDLSNADQVCCKTCHMGSGLSTLQKSPCQI